jgi:hypothetical protein
MRKVLDMVVVRRGAVACSIEMTSQLVGPSPLDRYNTLFCIVQHGTVDIVSTLLVMRWGLQPVYALAEL